MKRTWPVIAVGSVQASSRWYQQLLGCTNNHPDDPTFDQILDSDGTVLLCIHAWGEHAHPSLASPQQAKPGNGLLLFFCVDDFDEALARVEQQKAPLDEAPHENPNTRCMEFSLRDPDGYYVTVSAFDARHMLTG